MEVTPSGESESGRDPMIACLQASVKVRDGRWIKGAPTHVLAEFLNALADMGWVLRHEPPVCKRCGGRGWVTKIDSGRESRDGFGWGNVTNVNCPECRPKGLAHRVT